MPILRNVVYALIASFLLVTVSVAVQRTFFSRAPEAGGDLEQPTSGSRPAARVAASSPGEDDGSIDAATADSDRPSTGRGPATRRNVDAAADRTAAGSGTSDGDPTASRSRSWTWSSPLSVLARVFSSPSPGAGGGPGTVAPSAESVSAASPQSGSGPVSEIFFAEREETACQPGPREFVMDALRGLHVCVVWSGLSGTYASQLTFLSPDGHVYQTMTLAFVTPDAPSTVATMEVGGRQYAVRRAGWGRAGEALLVTTLPVAGTYITQHNLAGGWTVKVSLNGDLVDQDQFVLQPKQ